MKKTHYLLAGTMLFGLAGGLLLMLKTYIVPKKYISVQKQKKQEEYYENYNNQP